MTKKNALTVALNVLSTVTTDEANEARITLAKMIESLSKVPSDEAKAKQNELRKAKTAAARAELVAKVAPVLREELSHTLEGVTVKELFSLAQAKLPEDFTANKVQNILLREMRDELVITEAKGKANTYALKSVVE